MNSARDPSSNDTAETNLDLEIDLTTIHDMGALMADHAGGLLLQTVAGFSQGYMQVMTAALGRAAAEIVSSDGARGQAAMEKLQDAMKDLPQFVQEMAAAASALSAALPPDALRTEAGTQFPTTPETEI